MSIPPIAGPFLAAVLLLGGAGLVKLVRPHDTAVALRAAGWGLRLSRAELAVRIGAAAELAVATGALLAPGPLPATLVAVSYLGFSGFIATALHRRWPIASCGCFGRPDTVPTKSHVVVNAAAALAAGWWALAAHARVRSAVAQQPGDGIPLVLGALVCALLAYLVLTNPLAQARHRPPPAARSSRRSP